MHRRLVDGGGCGVTVRGLGGDRAGEIRLTRFLRNPAVSTDEMVTTAARRTAERCVGVGHVLAIQDTTVTRSRGGGGDYLHATIALDATGEQGLLGLVDGRCLTRTSGKKKTRRARPIEDKESSRWLSGTAVAALVCAGAARLTVVADRECDIYECFARAPAGVDLLVRAAHNRALADGGRLFRAIDAAPEAGRTILELPARPGAAARRARLSVRFEQAILRKPANGVRRRSDPRTVTLWAVDLAEIEAPAGAAVVHWRLLTTHRVTTLEEALEVADLYRRRWGIEQLFRTLKTQGFDIEGLRIEERAPREKLVMATLVAAVTVQQLVHARDGAKAGQPLRPLTDAFDPADRPLLEALNTTLEGKTERQKNPHPKGSLAYAAWVCARLGDWTGYYGKPGPIVLLRGYLRFKAAARGAHLAMAMHDV